MSQAENDIRLAVAAYKECLPVGKPKITLTVFADGEIQLFLHDPDATSVTHAQGQGKTLEEAASALKTHLIKRVTEVTEKDKADLEKLKEGKAKLYERIEKALATIKPAEES